MRTDYFDDLVQDFVTTVTSKKPGLVTLESNNKANINSHIDKALPVLPLLPVKTSNTQQKHHEETNKRHAYRFVLRDGQGSGVYLTDEADLDKARDSLAKRYGVRLALVVMA